ncbi:hypothetical protein GE09DRAFT_215143 [Coniochaeta sp. 2T2.1]|nr:hypothetical protein GE09DRAFT_215143 [Coniochaeta sp. 2T2.1]
MQQFRSSTMSGLRPPTRYTATAAPSAALNEISDSQANARAAAAMPPPPHGTKRPNTDYPQPDAKRKPLWEQAGEYEKPKKSHLPPPKVLSKVTTKPSSIVGLTTKQPLSRSSSTTSGHSRHTSTSSYAQSVGPGHRPQTSMGNNNFGQSVSGNGARPRANTSRRPATAMGNRGPDPDTSTGSQCMNPPARFHSPRSSFASSYARKGGVVNPRLRPSASTPSFIPSPSPPVRLSSMQSISSRQSSLASLASRFGHLAISEEAEADDGSHHQNGEQVNSKQAKHSATTPAATPPGLPASDLTVMAGAREKVSGQ